MNGEQSGSILQSNMTLRARMPFGFLIGPYKRASYPIITAIAYLDYLRWIVRRSYGRSADRQPINAKALDLVRRILWVACETGLRPGDLINLTIGAVEQTPAGRRLRVRTNKRVRLAHIPITPELAEIIDTTPREHHLTFSNASGGATD